MDLEQIIIDIKKRIELFSAEVFADNMLKKTKQDWIDEYLKDSHYDIVNTITDRCARAKIKATRINELALSFLNEQMVHVFEDGIIRELNDMEITEEELDYILEECDLN
jgi:hypothetical protein